MELTRYKFLFITFFLIVSVIAVFHASAAAVTRELVLLYDFTEDSGNVIHDRTAIEPRLDLIIPDTSKVEWLKPGLKVKSAMVALTTAARTKLDPSLFFSQGITIEIWAKPLNNTQGGPARIVTFSKDSGFRNFTLGQSADEYNQRFRTDQTNNNGSDAAISTLADTIKSAPTLQHVVYVRHSTGEAQFFVDKELVVSGRVDGANNWDMSYDFGLFNETNFPTDTRTWLGEIHLVAIYRTALTPAEIGDNYLAGPNRAPPAKPNGTGYVTLAWDANTEPDLANYKIYYGHEPENYKWSILVGAADQKANRDPGCPDPYDPFKLECCEYTLKGLNEGQTYYLAATALDEDDNESAYSDELIHTVEFKQPGQGTNLRYKDVKLFFKWSSPIIHELLEPKE